MTIKRSLSMKLKNTLARTKRIVSSSTLDSQYDRNSLMINTSDYCEICGLFIANDPLHDCSENSDIQFDMIQMSISNSATHSIPTVTKRLLLNHHNENSSDNYDDDTCSTPNTPLSSIQRSVSQLFSKALLYNNNNNNNNNNHMNNNNNNINNINNNHISIQQANNFSSSHNLNINLNSIPSPILHSNSNSNSSSNININSSTGTSVSNSNSNINMNSELIDNTPTLLYTGKRRSNSIRRSIRQHSLDYMDTNSTYITPHTSHMHLNEDNVSNHDKISIINDNIQFHDTENHSITYSNNNDVSNESNTIAKSNIPENNEIENEIILLPKNPIDTSIPPFTEDQLTPIIPDSNNSSLNNNYFEIIERSKSKSFQSQRQHSQSSNTNLSSIITNSAILNDLNNNNNNNNIDTSNTGVTVESSIRTPISFNQSSISSASASTSPNKYYKVIDADYPSLPSNDKNTNILQDTVSSIFTKSNQIDHLDKSLDVRQNDLLADQMALNILQHIDEENIDELSKLKDEIKFQSF